MSDEIQNEIWQAIADGKVDSVRALFEKHSDQLKHYYGVAESWLKVAVRYGSYEIVRLLLGLGCDVNVGRKGSLSETPLWTAVCHDRPDLVRLLLEYGADPNRGRILISAIVEPNEHSLELVKLLEQYGADLHTDYVNELSNKPMNALSSAMDWGKDDVVEYLLSKGCVPPKMAPSQPAAAPSFEQEVIAHFNEHFGPVDPRALIEIVPTSWPSIAVHFIPASKERPYITLFTTGLSNEAMEVPERMEDFRYAELYIQLPANWPYQDLGNPSHSWPTDWLRSTAQHPHLNDTWLGGPVAIIANDEPPHPLAPNVGFTSMLLLALKRFVRRDGQTVQLYQMTPLYTEERNLELREGIGGLMQAFDRHHVPFVVDVNRPNVGKRD